MRQRKQITDVAVTHLGLRKQFDEHFSAYENHHVRKVLKAENLILSGIEQHRKECDDKDLGEFYTALEYVLKSIFSLIRWTQSSLTGETGSERFLTSAKANAAMFREFSEKLDLTRPSILSLTSLSKLIDQATLITEVPVLVIKFSKIPLPVFYTTAEKPFAGRFRNQEEVTTEPFVEPPLVISVLFYIDQELWANPQTLKKEHQYIIRGKLKLNRWPEGYDKLLLSHASTTDDSWFMLSLPAISPAKEDEINIEGSIIFKYAQASFASPISIRLIGRFISDTLPSLYPQVIGYDELKVRIAELGSFPYLTGYDKLNQKAFEIASALVKEIQGITNEEIHNFMTLLSAILNYQGFCSQFAEYKNVTGISENDFRDRLIRYLAARNIASDISKEGHLAGGRVEINYKGIVAELKVESEIADRTATIDKHKNQPAAYASAASAQLSILCILDIVKKNVPPGPALNNVFLVKPEHHGFEITAPALESRIAVVFIDANTPDPSKY